MESVVQHLKILFDWQINNIPSSQSVTFSKDAKVWVHKTWKPQIFGGVFQNFFLLLWLKTTFEHFSFSPFENALCFHPFNFQRWKPQLSFLSHQVIIQPLLISTLSLIKIYPRKNTRVFFFCEIEKLEKKIFTDPWFLWKYSCGFFYVDSLFWRGW